MCYHLFFCLIWPIWIMSWMDMRRMCIMLLSVSAFWFILFIKSAVFLLIFCLDHYLSERCVFFLKNMSLLKLISNNKQWSKSMQRTWIEFFFQRRCANGHQIYKRMFNITNHHENSDQSHNEISHPLVRMSVMFSKENKR